LLLVRRARERHSLSRERRWLIIAVTALMLIAPATALAGNPAENQYQLPPVSATGSGGGGDSKGRLNPPSATTGSSSSAATVAILAGGVVAIGGAAGLILYRRRRDHPGESG
jgi:LPXTG-motif cell wall-anchored protein